MLVKGNANSAPFASAYPQEPIIAAVGIIPAAITQKLQEISDQNKQKEEAPVKPKTDELKHQVDEIENAVLTAEGLKNKLERIGEKLQNQGQLIGPMIGQAIANSANDGDESAEKSGQGQRRTNTISSKSDRD